MSLSPSHQATKPRDPGVIAKWLLIVFVAGALAFLGVPVVKALRHGAEAEILMTFVFLPWIVGPAAAAALLAMRSRSSLTAWAFVGAEVAAIASTAWLWITLVILEPDPQNSIMMMVFPAFQFAVLLAYALGVLAIALFLRRSRSARA